MVAGPTVPDGYRASLHPGCIEHVVVVIVVLQSVSKRLQRIGIQVALEISLWKVATEISLLNLDHCALRTLNGSAQVQRCLLTCLHTCLYTNQHDKPKAAALSGDLPEL